MNGKQRILVVAAHPDDEVLGCGASIARHASRGDEVWTLILGEGISSRKNLSKSKVSGLLKKLWADSRSANSLLGVRRVIQKRFPDNQFDSVSRLQIVHAIEEVVEAFKPATVYTHSSADLNIDHQIVSEAVRTACRPLPGSPIRRVLAFEVPSATEWRFNPGTGFQPNVFVDVSAFLHRKIEALRAYKGEIREFPHPRSEEYLRALAQTRGGQSGLKAAEAFCLLRGIEP